VAKPWIASNTCKWEEETVVQSGNWHAVTPQKFDDGGGGSGGGDNDDDDDDDDDDDEH
jgi:hypothetical protein